MKHGYPLGQCHQTLVRKLQSGPKSYDQLKGLIPNLDYLLRWLLKTKEIVRYPDGESFKYGLRIQPAEITVKLPPRPILHLPRKTYGTKRCRCCGVDRPAAYFGHQRAVCNKCRYRQKTLLKAGEATSSCGSGPLGVG